MAFKGNLWHHKEFLKFWTGDTITQFTGQISGLALAVLAVQILNVTDFEVGVLNALGFIAFPTLGLFVGVWMDRMKRKRVMIVMDMIQVATLASVPTFFVISHALFLKYGLYLLYTVEFMMGLTTLFFDVAYQSYLPSLVNKEDVVEGNQKLQTSASAATVVGPSVASGLMAIIDAALTVAVDAIGTLAGAFALLFIRKPEPELTETSAGGERDFFGEMKEGIKVVTRNKLLWTQAGCTATLNLGFNIFNVALILFALRSLNISKGLIGIAFTIGAVGFFAGAMISTALTGRLGVGRTIALAVALTSGQLIALLANHSDAVFVIGVAYFIANLGLVAYNVNQVSLRQIITPNRLQGRMNATMRTIVWGTVPAGSLIGGILCTGFGIVPAAIVGAIVAGGGVLWIVFGPIFKLSKLPEPVGD